MVRKLPLRGHTCIMDTQGSRTPAKLLVAAETAEARPLLQVCLLIGTLERKSGSCIWNPRCKGVGRYRRRLGGESDIQTIMYNEGGSLEGPLTTRGLVKMGLQKCHYKVILQKWMAISQARRI